MSINLDELLFTEREYVTPKGLLRLELSAAPADDERYAGRAYYTKKIERVRKDKNTGAEERSEATIVIVRFRVVEVLGKQTPANAKFVGETVTTVVDLEMGGDKSGNRKLAKAILGKAYNPKTAAVDFSKALRSATGSFDVMVLEDPKPDGKTYSKINLDTATPVED